MEIGGLFDRLCDHFLDDGLNGLLDRRFDDRGFLRCNDRFDRGGGFVDDRLRDGDRHCLRTLPHLQPHVVAGARRDHTEARVAPLGLEIMFDRAELFERLPLIERHDLSEHAEDGFGREHARRQINLPPQERTSVLAHGRRRGHHVRLLADVQDQRVPVQADDRVEQ